MSRRKGRSIYKIASKGIFQITQKEYDRCRKGALVKNTWIVNERIKFVCRKVAGFMIRSCKFDI